MRPVFQSLAVLTFVSAWAAASPVAAQTIPSAFSFIEERQEVGPFFGYMNASTGRFGYGPSGGLSYGARYGLQLGGPMSLEAVAGIVDGTRDVVDPGRVAGQRVIGDADVQIATVDVRLKFSATGDRSWHSLSPFMFLGAGVAFDLADAAAIEETLEDRDVFEFGTSFFGTLGLGTRWFVTDSFGLRTDGAFSLWRISTPPGFSDTDRGFAAVEDREWVRGLSATVSLVYRW